MHNFGAKTYTSPTYCACCSRLLVGFSKQGLQCVHCKLDVHSGCRGAAEQKFACLNQVVGSELGLPLNALGPPQAPPPPPPLPPKNQPAPPAVAARPSAPEALSSSSFPLVAVAHNFSATTFTKPTNCVQCGKMLLGVYHQGVSCSVCGCAAHKGSCAQLAVAETPCVPKDKSGTSKSFSLSSILGKGSSEESSGLKISGPTNFQHVAGTTTGRTLVPIKQAQEEARAKQDSYSGAAAEGARKAPERPAPPPRPPAPSEAADKPSSLSYPKPPSPKSKVSAFFGSHSQETVRPLTVNNLSTSVDKITISGPTDFTHTAHGTFSTSRAEFSGLPTDWASQSAAASLCFGASITSQPRVQLTGYEERIPTIAVLLARELRRRNAFLEEGIFRIAPSRTEQARVKALLQVSTGGVLPALQGCSDAHVVAGLLKEWCRMLRPPLMNELSAQQTAALAQVELDAEGSASPADSVQIFKSLLFEKSSLLSPACRALLLWLLDVMRQVVVHKEHNRMGARAVATCFAPSLYVVDDPVPLESIQTIKFVSTVLSNSLHALDILEPELPLRDCFGDQNGAFQE